MSVHLDEAARRCAEEGLTLEIVDGSVVLANANTTVGYAKYSCDSGSIDYIFVHPAFRRRGWGRLLFELSQASCAKVMTPAPPISPWGEIFFGEVGRRASGR